MAQTTSHAKVTRHLLMPTFLANLFVDFVRECLSPTEIKHGFVFESWCPRTPPFARPKPQMASPRESLHLQQTAAKVLNDISRAIARQQARAARVEGS